MSSFCNLLYHIVFSTKDHEPWLGSEIRPRVNAYLGGAIRNEGGIPMIINGTSDHVHILAKLRQDKTVSKMVGEMKANSSRWISETFPEARLFEWQAGYGAFSVSQSQVAKVHAYIDQQEQHHRKVPFVEELKKLLDAHGIEFNANYL